MHADTLMLAHESRCIPVVLGGVQCLIMMPNWKRINKNTQMLSMFFDHHHVSQSSPTSEATLTLHSITAPVRHIIYTTTQFHENTIACITFFLTNLKRLICCRYTQNLVTPLVNNWNLQFKTCRGSWSEHKSKTPKMCFTIALIDKTIGLLFVNKDTSMNKVKWNMKMKYTIYNYWAYN